MRLHTTRQTPLTGDVKTVAALNATQIAPFQVMDRWCSDMLDPGFTTVAILRQEMAVSLLTASFQMLDRGYSDMLPQGHPTVAMLR